MTKLKREPLEKEKTEKWNIRQYDTTIPKRTYLEMDNSEKETFEK